MTGPGWKRASDIPRPRQPRVLASRAAVGIGMSRETLKSRAIPTRNPGTFSSSRILSNMYFVQVNMNSPGGCVLVSPSHCPLILLAYYIPYTFSEIHNGFGLMPDIPPVLLRSGLHTVVPY